VRSKSVRHGLPSDFRHSTKSARLKCLCSARMTRGSDGGSWHREALGRPTASEWCRCGRVVQDGESRKCSRSSRRRSTSRPKCLEVPTCRLAEEDSVSSIDSHKHLARSPAWRSRNRWTRSSTAPLVLQRQWPVWLGVPLKKGSARRISSAAALSASGASEYRCQTTWSRRLTFRRRLSIVLDKRREF